MTHHNISYADLEGDAKRDKAMNDIREYIGNEKFAEMNTALNAWVKEFKPSLQQFERVLFLFPVSGYPLIAWYQTLTGYSEDEIRAITEGE